jgi:hypothetical protein
MADGRLKMADGRWRRAEGRWDMGYGIWEPFPTDPRALTSDFWISIPISIPISMRLVGGGDWVLNRRV